MKMRRGDPPRAANPSDDLALPDLLPGDHIELRQVRVVALHPVAMRDNHQPAVSSVELSPQDDPVRSSLNRSSGRRRNIDAGVISAFSRERIHAMTERAHES